MHEVSLMSNLLAIVDHAAAQERGGPVRVIHLKVGEMAGVNIDALQFAFDCLSRGTSAEGGRLEFERVPLVARCRRCGARSNPKECVFTCGACGSDDLDILSGREMEVDYILVGDDDGRAGGVEPREGEQGIA